MPLRVRYNIKHNFYNGSIEELDKYAGDMINDGWELVDSKVIHTDFYARIFVVFYIWSKKAE